MAKLTKITLDPDAGRVRSRMIGDLLDLRKCMKSELEAYGHLFTAPERKRLASMIGEAKSALRLLEMNENRRCVEHHK